MTIPNVSFSRMYTAIVIVVIALVATTLFILLTVDPASSQPQARFIVFNGDVRINGEVAPEGVHVFLSVAGSTPIRELSDVTDARGRFNFIKFGPSTRSEGSDLRFILADGTVGVITMESVTIGTNRPVVISTERKTSTPFTFLNAAGNPASASWILGHYRTVSLDFPHLAVPTPTPTPIPTGAQFFNGTVPWPQTSPAAFRTG